MTKDREYIDDAPIGRLKPYPGNPRLNEAAVDYVANSIRELGFRAPILVDGDWVVVAGHTRLEAAKRLGLKRVPVVVYRDMTPEQARAYRLADNKTAEKAGWDFDALDRELLSLDGVFDMADFGFDFSDPDLFAADDGSAPAPEAPEREEEPEAPAPEAPAVDGLRPGDLAMMGDRLLLCVAARDGGAWRTAASGETYVTSFSGNSEKDEQDKYHKGHRHTQE